jgi:hypothetical protein
MLHGTLRRGDLVQVRGAAEILDTLDDSGAVEALPFMPEMVAYCGRRFTVERLADKICDTITYSGSRELSRAVLLEELRCDGAGHGGCQAACRLFWKEAWLKRVAPGEPAPTEVGLEDPAAEKLLERVDANARAETTGVEVSYRCQATELVRASFHLSKSDPRVYLRELTTGDVDARTFVRVMARSFSMKAKKQLGRLDEPPLQGVSTTSPPKEPPLDLRPGEWVRVKSAEQVRQTLTKKGMNRGLWFDREMLQYCGRAFRVRARVTRLLDEATGAMIELGSDCVQLEGAVCSGEFTQARWFCPRAPFPLWRECWLERVDTPRAADEVGPRS